MIDTANCSPVTGSIPLRLLQSVNSRETPPHVIGQAVTELPRTVHVEQHQQSEQRGTTARERKRTTEEFAALNADKLRVAGLLTAGHAGILWFVPPVSGCAKIEIRCVAPAALSLSYVTESAGGRVQREAQITVAWKSDPICRVRPYLVCPGCQKTFRILRGPAPSFGCTGCLSMNYRVQQAPSSQRPALGAVKLLERLGASRRAVIGPPPARPAGMHARTYLELLVQLRRREVLLLRHAQRRATRMLTRALARECRQGAPAGEAARSKDLLLV